MDRKLDQVDRKFDQVDRKFDQVDRRFNSLELSVGHLAARFRNSTLTRLHQKIHVVHILDHSQSLDGTLIEPPHFPKNVKAFMNLRGKTTPSAAVSDR